MNSSSPKTRIVPAAILLACAATQSYANPQTNTKESKPASTKAATLVQVRKDPVRTVAQASVPVVLPLYLPPSRGQVRLRSSAATRSASSTQNPTVAAIDL